MIQTKRVYEPASAQDGARFLVERLWPRGMKKEVLKMDGWLKDVAPSAELRQWYSHDPAKWEEFQSRYWHELDANHPSLEPLREAVHRGNVTLLYSARDMEHNSALALKVYLGRHTAAKTEN
jgi:uncharacterized protein YeaO (DUF488 family)